MTADIWGNNGFQLQQESLYDHCKLSAFDAHMGVGQCTIRNWHLDSMGINAIGKRNLLGGEFRDPRRNLINLAPTMGAPGQGELINAATALFVPAGGRPSQAALIGGYNSGPADFGYTLLMPARIPRNLQLIDTIPGDYQGPAIFGNFNRNEPTKTYQELFPYQDHQRSHLKKCKDFKWEEFEAEREWNDVCGVKVIRKVRPFLFILTRINEDIPLQGIVNSEKEGYWERILAETGTKLLIVSYTPVNCYYNKN